MRQSSGQSSPIEEFKRLRAEHQAGLVDPYFVCFQSAARGAAIVAVGLPGEESLPIRLVFGQQTEFSFKAARLWQLMRQYVPHCDRIQSYRMADMPDELPLQAADLVAYELFKDCEKRRNRPQDDVRWALQRILKRHHYLFDYLDYSDLENRFLPDSMRPPIGRELDSWVRLTPGARLLAEKDDSGKWRCPSLTTSEYKIIRNAERVALAESLNRLVGAR